MKLSSRERLLVFLLALIIVGWGGVQYLVIPAISEYQQLKLDHQYMLEKQLELQQKLARQHTIDKEIMGVKENINIVSKQFFEYQEVEFFYDWLVDMGEKYDVIIESLALTEPQYTSVESYDGSIADATYPLREYKKQIEAYILEDQEGAEGVSGEVTAEGSKDQLVHYAINIEVQGKQEKMMALINGISEESRYAIVEKFSLANQKQEKVQEGEKEEVPQGQMTISFYAIDKLELDSSTDEEIAGQEVGEGE